MKNQAFARQGENNHRRKIQVVLSKLTGDRLSEEQRLALEQIATHQCQYRILVADSKQVLVDAIKTGEGQKIEAVTLLGDASNPPWAVLLQAPIGKKAVNTLYIYIPKEKEEDLWNDS